MEPVSGILLVPVVQKVVVQERTTKESADIYGQMELVGQKEAERIAIGHPAKIQGIIKVKLS